jgi:hypothetical protein
LRSALICLALLLLVSAGKLTAQDPQDRFGGVTNEPRPAEYLHWDADTYREWHRDLEARIESGSRIWDTKFVFFSALEGMPDRPHNISIVHRKGYAQPEIREHKWDLYVVLEGSGSILVGGERIGWVDGRPPEEQRSELQGAQEFTGRLPSRSYATSVSPPMVLAQSSCRNSAGPPPCPPHERIESPAGEKR